MTFRTGFFQVEHKMGLSQGHSRGINTSYNCAGILMKKENPGWLLQAIQYAFNPATAAVVRCQALQVQARLLTLSLVQNEYKRQICFALNKVDPQGVRDPKSSKGIGQSRKNRRNR